MGEAGDSELTVLHLFPEESGGLTTVTATDSKLLLKASLCLHFEQTGEPARWRDLHAGSSCTTARLSKRQLEGASTLFG